MLSLNAQGNAYRRKTYDLHITGGGTGGALNLTYIRGCSI